jgi:octaprenyl-diphosphate synthase
LNSTVTRNAKEVFDLLHDDLAAIEREFGRDTVSDVRAITEIGEYLRAGGGKRLRPALLLLSCKLMNYTGQGAIKFQILDTLIDLTQAMVEGELLQIERLGKAITIDEHFELIYRKTACLFSVCMKLGGILAGAPEADVQRLADYGRNLGMAFQLVDDVLDLTASEEILGKPVASDLREGKATWAVLHALERCTPEERATIESVLGNGGFNGITPADIVAILNRYGSIDAAYASAIEFASQARESICRFPDSEIKRVLLWVPEFVVERQS